MSDPVAIAYPDEGAVRRGHVNLAEGIGKGLIEVADVVVIATHDDDAGSYAISMVGRSSSWLPEPPVAGDLPWKQAFGDDVVSAAGRRQGCGRHAGRAKIGRADRL